MEPNLVVAPARIRSTQPHPIHDVQVTSAGQFLPYLGSSVLEALEEGEKQRASRILEACPAHLVAEGARPFIADLARAEVLIVERGFLVVHATQPRARRVIVAEAGPGAVLLVPAGHEHLQALTECWITSVSLTTLEGLLAIPGTAATLFRGLGNTLRLSQDARSDFGSVRHVDRVRQKLLQLARQFGRVSPDGIRIEFPLTHDLLAEMVASARETVTRALDQLQRSGFLARDGHSYRLLISPEELDVPP
jgi:CRP-like cAMP-binding protein